MSNIDVFQKCSNCGACYNICPANAISVKKDELFYRPVVDEAKCFDCGLCQSVCPVNAPRQVQKMVRAYAAIHDDAKVVQNSSSGGVFYALAELTLRKGGVVFGAAYEENFRKVSMCSTDCSALKRLQKSKYVESLVGLTFREVKEQLEQGRAVLYCGAPCQIAGLKRFLGKEYDNLLACDFSCGGMPSHKLYRQWIDHIERKLRSCITGVDFRPKTFGWYPHAIKVSGRNGRVYSRLAGEDAFFDCFIGKHITVRDYCLECEFANNHYADIVLADFWKYRSISKVDNKNKGISLLITNSEKGERAIAAVSEHLALTVLDVEEASYNLVEKCVSTAFAEERAAFLRKCEAVGFVRAERKRNRNWKFRMKYRIKKLLGRV